MGKAPLIVVLDAPEDQEVKVCLDRAIASYEQRVAAARSLITSASVRAVAVSELQRTLDGLNMMRAAIARAESGG